MTAMNASRTLPAIAALFVLSACAATPPYARLPIDAVDGAGDPTRAAIIGTAYFFNTQGTAGASSDAAARAAAQVEYLAAEIPTGPRWVEFSPVVGLELLAARDELRAALGVAPGTAPQAVVDGLYAAGRALRAGDRTAAATLLPNMVRDRQATLASLERLPALPRTRVATALAERELRRVDQGGQQGAGSDGGRGN